MLTLFFIIFHYFTKNNSKIIVTRFADVSLGTCHASGHTRRVHRDYSSWRQPQAEFDTVT